MQNLSLLAKIKAKRLEMGISSKYMAELLNMTKSNYSQIENSKQGLTLENFIEICKVLKISPSNLLEDESKTLILSNEDINTLFKATELLKKFSSQLHINQSINIENVNNHGSISTGDINIGNIGNEKDKKKRTRHFNVVKFL